MQTFTSVSKEDVFQRVLHYDLIGSGSANLMQVIRLDADDGEA